MTYTRIDPNNIPPDTRFWAFNLTMPNGDIVVSGVFCATPAELQATVGKKLFFPVRGTPGDYGAHGEARGTFAMSQCISLTNNVDYIKMHLENEFTINSPLEHVVDEWPEEVPSEA